MGSLLTHSRLKDIMTLLQDKVAIVTGGNAGIGKAIAHKLAQQGAKVVIFANNAERGAQTVASINEATGRDCASFVACDVSKLEAVSTAIDNVVKQHGALDIVVNNAGITRDQLILRMKEQDWDDVINTNLKSVFNVCKAATKPMLRRGGKIVNISSVVGLTGNPGQVNYCASKSGIHGFSKALARELAKKNICVNCVAPGFVASDMTEKLTDAQKEEIMRSIPQGRMGSPEEIANTVLFLASDLSNYVTGQIVSVDGGMAM